MNSNSNPFITLNKNQIIESKAKEENNDYEKFDKYNPFNQKLNDPFSLFKNNLPKKDESSNEEKDNNSQKKFINNDEGITPKKDDNVFKFNGIQTNNLIKDVKMDNKEFNQKKIFINEKAQKESNEQKMNLIKENNYKFNDFSGNPKNDSNKIMVMGKKLFNFSKIDNNNIFQIYDNKTDSLNIDNLNKLIEKNQSHKTINSNLINLADSNLNLGVINEEKNESDKEIVEMQKNNLNLNLNKNYTNLISINKLLQDENDSKELDKIVKENSDEINSLLNAYNRNIIKNIIDIDISTFKTEINKFINESKQTIEKFQIIGEIQSNIREKMMLNYELQKRMHIIKMNEYKKIKEYEEKLDYIILVQNKLIKEFEDMNIQLTSCLNESNPNDKGEKINDDEINKNIEIACNNFDELDKLIKITYGEDNGGNDIDKDIDEINKIDLNNENCLFFDVLEKMLNPIKNINKEYQKIMIGIMDLNSETE